MTVSDDGKTYSDLMAVLPEVAEIHVRWTWRDGDPSGVAGFTLIGHGGISLANVDASELQTPRVAGPITPDLPLIDRLPLVAHVLEWTDPFNLEEHDGVSVIRLPSPDHIPDSIPEEWNP
jgi:hypothetical protein